MTDIVERLNKTPLYEGYGEQSDLPEEAADEIVRLRAENERLREALEPLATAFLWPDDLGFEMADDIKSDPDYDEDANDMASEEVFILRRDVRRARAARKENSDE